MKRRKTIAELRKEIGGLRLLQSFPDLVRTFWEPGHIIVDRPELNRWFRVHPDPAKRWTGYLLQLRSRRGRRRPLYCRIMKPELVAYIVRDIRRATLYLAIDRQGNVYLIPLMVDQKGKPKASRTGPLKRHLDLAMKEFISLVKKGSGRHYDRKRTRNKYPEPDWPELTIDELLDIAFDEDHRIASLDHWAVLDRLAEP